MKVYFIVLGSSTAAWREDLSSGKTLAEGWSEPFLQKAGLSIPRTLAESQTRRDDAATSLEQARAEHLRPEARAAALEKTIAAAIRRATKLGEAAEGDGVAAKGAAVPAFSADAFSAASFSVAAGC